MKIRQRRVRPIIERSTRSHGLGRKGRPLYQPYELGHAPVPLITAREVEVLQHLADGLTRAEAAYAMGITVETVKTHLRSAFVSLDVRTQAGAVAAAIRKGLVS